MFFFFFTLKSVPDHLAVPIDTRSASPDDPFAHAPRKTAVAVCSSPPSSSPGLGTVLEGLVRAPKVAGGQEELATALCAATGRTAGGANFT